MLTRELLIPEQQSQITSEPSWVMFFIPFRIIYRSTTFETLSTRLCAFDPSFQSQFCGSHGHNALPQFFPFLMMSTTERAALVPWIRRLWWCSAAQEEWGLCSACLTLWHSSSSCCSPSLSPDTQKCPLFLMSWHSCHGSWRASVLGSAHQP